MKLCCESGPRANGKNRLTKKRYCGVYSINCPNCVTNVPKQKGKWLRQKLSVVSQKSCGQIKVQHTSVHTHTVAHTPPPSLNEAWWFVVWNCGGVVLITGVSVAWHKLAFFNYLTDWAQSRMGRPAHNLDTTFWRTSSTHAPFSIQCNEQVTFRCPLTDMSRDKRTSPTIIRQ